MVVVVRDKVVVMAVSPGEYIQDTEEYINIELDSSRNRLIRLEIILTAGTFALAIFTLVGGDLASYLPPLTCLVHHTCPSSHHTWPPSLTSPHLFGASVVFPSPRFGLDAFE